MALTVNGVEIHNQQLDEAFAVRVDEYRKMCASAEQPADDAQLRTWIEEDAIEGVLFYQAAQKKFPLPTEAQIRKYIREYPAEFAHVPEAEHLATGQRQLMMRVFRRDLRKQVERPTSAQVEAFYLANPQRFNQPEYWAVSHICRVITPENDQASAFLELCRLRQDILAKKMSWQEALPYSSSYAYDQGLFGVVQKGQYPQFEETFFALKEGEVSDVIDSGERVLHLFCVLRHETARQLALDEAKTDIEKQLFDDAFAAVLDKTYAELVAGATIIRT